MRSEQVRLELPISMSAAPNSFHRVVTSGLGEKIFDSLRSFASLMRVKPLVPSFLIVAALFEPMH